MNTAVVRIMMLFCRADCQLCVHKSCVSKLQLPCPGGTVRSARMKDNKYALSTVIESFRSQLPVAAVPVTGNIMFSYIMQLLFTHRFWLNTLFPSLFCN